MTDVINLINEYESLKTQFENKLSEELKFLFEDFFEKNTIIKAIFWTQYTPYFNDGEPCVFGVNEKFCSTVEGVYEDEENPIAIKPQDFHIERQNVSEYCKDIVENWNNASDQEKTESQNFTEFCRILDIIPNEVYLSAYGDGVKIVVTRNGVITEYYDHE